MQEEQVQWKHACICVGVCWCALDQVELDADAVEPKQLCFALPTVRTSQPFNKGRSY